MAYMVAAKSTQLQEFLQDSFVDLEKQQKRIRKIGLLKRNLNKCKFLY